MLLPKSIIYFLLWWLFYAPKKLFQIVKKLTLLVNNQLSFTMNLKLIFTPLYGDYTVIGRLIGFFLRIVFIITGFIFVASLSTTAAILPIVWYILPAAIIYYLDFWVIPIFLGIYLYVTYLNLNQADKRILEVVENNKTAAFKPNVKKLLSEIKKRPTFTINKFLEAPNIEYILEKCELNNKDFKEKLSHIKDLDIEKIKELAFSFAKENKARYVEEEHLFLGTINSIKNVDNLLAYFGSDLKIIKEAVFWVVGEREELAKLYFWQDDYEMPPITGFGHGLVGRVTPYLDSVSTDYTKMVRTGRLRNIVGREEEIEKIANLLDSSKENVLMMGEPGCGKTSIVMGIAHKIMHGTKYKTLQNKRVVSLELGSLIAGAKEQGALAEKLKYAIEDAIGSGDIIIFIDEIHSLAGSAGEDEGFATAFSVLEPYLSSNEIQLIGATSIENYRKFIEPVGSFSRLFENVEIPESNPEDTLKILKYVASLQEQEHRVDITVPALIKIIELSNKLVHDKVNPDKSIDILIRSVSSAKNSSKVVNVNLVEKEVSEMTHVPVTSISEEESEKLLNILDEMKKRVVGQDHALEKIAAALKRARAGIRDENKPIASFLFVGTTGVGKTETAKTLSSTYFGNEEDMIRLDMSEYQNTDSMDKLIGTSDGETRGILTEAVRSKPFAVVLLDEIEKAHQNILLTFLQVLDDGILTDSTGRKISFNNTIIIATSNVGTREIQEITDRGGKYDEIEKAATEAVRSHFAPEFLNRFTSVVIYKPLDTEQIRKIARILLNKVKKIAEEKDIGVSFSEELLDELVKRGYNPEWGARPMARVIEENVETYLSEQIINKKVRRGDTIAIGKEIFD